MEQPPSSPSLAASGVGNLASGNAPTAAFPCDHLISPGQADKTYWAPPANRSPGETLAKLVADEDWAGLFAEGKTKFQVQAQWSASAERCEMLRCFCGLTSAVRVLEVGAFCGVATLAMAEALPVNGEVVSIEIDPFLVEYGKEIKQRSDFKHKINNITGSALECVEALASEAASGSKAPFDLVVIDADKDNMRRYFDLLCESPGLLSQQATVCIDVTPFKGQPPDRYVRFGQADKWEVNSGQEEIDKLRSSLMSSSEYTANEFGGCIIVKRRPRA